MLNKGLHWLHASRTRSPASIDFSTALLQHRGHHVGLGAFTVGSMGKWGQGMVWCQQLCVKAKLLSSDARTQSTQNGSAFVIVFPY